jgi:hypothetical protein
MARTRRGPQGTSLVDRFEAHEAGIAREAVVASCFISTLMTAAGGP